MDATSSHYAFDIFSVIQQHFEPYPMSLGMYPYLPRNVLEIRQLSFMQLPKPPKATTPVLLRLSRNGLIVQMTKEHIVKDF